MYFCCFKFANLFVRSSVGSTCCVFDSVCELFIEKVCHLKGGGCCFVVECNSVVGCLQGFSVP